ncbi:MAG: Glycosyl transferase family 2 [Candidatus Amesbacteria bacterium GW2011_GWA1_48_9]|uniref:Glycosyl transferase family 2 n=1 Tax=Candidatus Amesbacteria bacterium GW2011_GWA1_48_9 TaxID=1618355 RepID=A0A0G1V1C0_9BACT|nr:MAG: Glycosyl transferase family 2 [Candidatus Amesbacteria bacterium GW2011_GWA1_48_9]OGD02069.1 MAG: hypothetical protein A2354_02795 [Candidatus Amesbacteria bacterium RIFOXYB1_FULL_47_12]
MLSVVITAWNEEKNLPTVVNSVRRLADEIVVVVDKSSTDKTAAVAGKLGCKVFWHPHTGYVEPMRNFSISKATGDWILVLDADEEVPPKLAAQIKDILKQPAADYYRLPRKNLIFGKWITSQHWWPDYVYRLFKKGHVTWEDAIHSVPFTKGSGADLPADENLALIHYHYTGIGQYVDRLNRYTDHQLKHLQQNNHRFLPSDFLIFPFREFIRQFFARRGYRDGLHGLTLALLQAFSELVLYLKFWEQLKFPETPFNPGNLVSELRTTNSELTWWYYQSKIDTSSIFLKPWWKLVRRLKL